jgi:hypothetical protein
MGIVGDHPEAGTRFDLTRTTADAPWVYQGAAFTRETEHRLEVTVDAAGEVTIADEASLPKEVAQRAKMLLRTAFKRAKDETEGGAPPRRIHRWRAG